MIAVVVVVLLVVIQTVVVVVVVVVDRPGTGHWPESAPVVETRARSRAREIRTNSRRRRQQKHQG